MLAPIRAVLFKKALRDLLNANKRQRQVHTLDSARSVGLLFDATEGTARKESLEFAQALEKQGKKVSLLGYFDTKQVPAPMDFDYFFAKETAWTGKPDSSKASAFAQQKFDLLFVLNPRELPPLGWLAAQSQAAFKVGFASSLPNDLDVQLETPEGRGIRYFTEQLALYLGKIVLSKP
jgi:hypothetical protein